MAVDREQVAPPAHNGAGSNQSNENSEQIHSVTSADALTGIQRGAQRDVEEIGPADLLTERGKGGSTLSSNAAPILDAKSPPAEAESRQTKTGPQSPRAALMDAEETHGTDHASERESGDSAGLEAARAKFLASIDAIVDGKLELPAATVFRGQSDVLARLINLTSRLDLVEKGEGLYNQATLAATLLQKQPGSVSSVALILDDIDYATSRNSPIYTVMRGLIWSTACLFLGAIVVFGLSSMIYSLSSGQSWYQVVTGPYLVFITSPIVVSAFFGVLGSVVSILLRLSEFEKATRRSRQFLKMTGAMLPLVGAIFACVTCALFASGIINFSFATGDSGVRAIENPYFYVVIGFLSGFSERFTKGLLGSAETIVAAATRTDTQTLSTGSSTLTKTSGARVAAIHGA
jgi:hypothetical protein